MESELETPPVENTVTLEEGTRVGDYLITNRLGEGGMCEIFKAIDPGLARYVAIKVMLGHLRTPEALRDFLQEARVIAQMRHSNIVPIYSVGEIEGLPWLAMEFIEGPNMEMFLESHGPFSLAEAHDFLKQAASALAYAAKSNVIHLDIKPANFILDPNGTVLLADFGLARRISDVNSGALDDQELMGTPAFASPEHFLQTKPDLRTDIYCLGVTVYNLLTGALPYDADDAVDLCNMHLSSPFPIEKLQELNIPDGWCRFIRKMMEKKPEDRFQSYEELLEALKDIDKFSQGKMEIQSQLKGKRHTLPRSGGGPLDLFYMLPLDMVNQGEHLFRFDHPLKASAVRETLDKRWPVLGLNKLANRFLFLENPSETDVDDMLWALARIPEYKATLDSLALFMSADAGHDLKTDDEKLHFIGLDRTRNLAITARALLEDWQGECLMNHHNFWEYSIYSGFIAGMLADSLGLESTGYEFICGLLQDIGKLLLLELYPAKTITIWLEAYKYCLPLEELETHYFGLTHYELAAEWLSRNKFNKLICAVTLNQNNLEGCFESVKEPRSLLRSGYKKEEVDTLALVVACAKSLAKELQIGYCGSPFLEPIPWLEQPNTVKLLSLRSPDGIGERAFKKFFTETCSELPDMPLTQLAFAEKALALREANAKAAKPAAASSKAPAPVKHPA